MEEIKHNFNKSNFLLNISSKYILDSIFEHLHPSKAVKIIERNKGLKYIYKKYTMIEIKIFPLENEEGTFINFLSDSSYYHIYFNNDKKEIKRENKNYITKNDKVNKITVMLDYEIKSLAKLFRECNIIKKINFTNFIREDIEDMSSMFFDCFNLEELNLFNFDSTNVTNMSFMFYDCSSLKELDLSKFNTNKVINMNYMFYGCSSLKLLYLLNFNTSNVEDMNSMFNQCTSLKKLKISNFKTDKVTNMQCLFSRCSSLEELNISNFKIENVNYTKF